MHIEFTATLAKIKAVADRIRNGQNTSAGGEASRVQASRPQRHHQGIPRPTEDYSGMLRESVDNPRHKGHKAWTIKLQKAMNQWKSDTPNLLPDGELMGATITKVHELQYHNRKGAYRKAGGLIADSIPGPILYKMLDIPQHPYA